MTNICSICGKNQTRLFKVSRLKLSGVCLSCGRAAIAQNPPTPEQAKRTKARARRRERDQMMRDLGMVKTPFGWE